MSEQLYATQESSREEDFYPIRGKVQALMSRVRLTLNEHYAYEDKEVPEQLLAELKRAEELLSSFNDDDYKKVKEFEEETHNSFVAVKRFVRTKLEESGINCELSTIVLHLEEDNTF